MGLNVAANLDTEVWCYFDWGGGSHECELTS